MARSLRLRFSILLLALATPARAADVTITLDAGSGLSVRNSGGAVERLRVDEATGNISRNGALFIHTTGASNLFVGGFAGNLSTSGSGLNTAFGQVALTSNTTGTRNDAFGYGAMVGNTTGSRNSAFGSDALRFNSTGNYNAAFGTYALRSNTTGSLNSAFGEGALLSNLFAEGNSAFGAIALSSNTFGSGNSAFGHEALLSNVGGDSNSAFGKRALRNNSNHSNSAFGASALLSNTIGSNNSAFGNDALRATAGSRNSAFGRSALRNEATGTRNVAVGYAAGFNLLTGSNNIYIDNTGGNFESGQIRIGTVGTHTQTWIAGIHNVLSSGGTGVFVNSDGVLGTAPSSMRFKRDVRDMGEASNTLLKLRPVVFRYKREVVGAEESELTQYGLIAEEVAEVAPELVAPDADGRPYSVRYDELAPMLLNEVQEQQRTIDAQAGVIAEQRALIAGLSSRLQSVEARVAELQPRMP